MRISPTTLRVRITREYDGRFLSVGQLNTSLFLTLPAAVEGTSGWIDWIGRRTVVNPLCSGPFHRIGNMAVLVHMPSGADRQITIVIINIGEERQCKLL